MSGEIKFTHSTQEIPKPNQLQSSPSSITIHDLISFKEDLLKDLRQYKSKTTTNINSEFDKYLVLIEKTNNKMDFIEKEKSTFVQKADYTQDKNNIYLEISNSNTELKKQIMVEDVQITTIKKDIEEIIYKYDKTIIDNLQIPGLVGNSCRFPNLKEYILSNKDDMTKAIMVNKQTSMEFKSFKKKIEVAINQINEKIKSQEYKYLNLLNSKFNELKTKFDGLYEALDDKINNIKTQVAIEKNEKNKEIEKIDKLIVENKKKMNEKNEIIKEEFFTQVEDIKKSVLKIKKNITNLTNLLTGKNNGMNKKAVINNFNHMMNKFYKEFGGANLENNDVNQTINENNHEKSIMNMNHNDKKKLQNKLIFGKNQLNKTVNKIIKPSANSSIKDYIAGKISANDAKFNAENIKTKRKQSVKLINNNLLEFKNTINKNILTKNNTNDINHNILVPRMSLSTNNNFISMKDIKTSFNENKKNFERETQKRSSLKLDIEKKSTKNILKNFDIELNDENLNIKNKIKNDDEIINEEDSNKSNNSDNSKRDEENNKEKTRHNSQVNNNRKLVLDENNKINKKINGDNSSDMTSNSNSDSLYISKSVDNNINISNNKNNETENQDVNNKNNETENQVVNTINNSNQQNNLINNEQSINNCNEKTISNIIQNTNYTIGKENSKLNNEINKTNLTINEKIERNEKSFILLNKKKQNSKINLKKNININPMTNKINNNKLNILNSNNNNININNQNKNNDIIQISPSLINKINQGMNQTYSTNFRKNNSPLNTNNNIDSKYLNYISKTIVFQNKDLMIKSTKSTRNKNQKNNITEIKNNQKKEIVFSSFDGQKNNLNQINNFNNEISGLKTEKKEKEVKVKFDNKNVDKNDKEIYINNDVFKKMRFIKDEKIIDKPLILDRDIFKISQNKGSLENKIIELEYFTKKKFDELVKEIKTFIPIHFNSHLKDYTFKKQNDNIYII